MTERHGRVLVVDDHKTNRMKLALAVQNLGHEVETVASGAECLASLRRDRFDIVLLDIVMPEMDGFQVLAAIKADPKLRDIPVIVISSLEEMEDAVRAIQLGADDFLTKAFNPVLLKARVDAGIERKRLRDKELEYLHQVERLAAASGIVEGKDFDPARLGLDDIARRDDQLGNLARVFLQMAGEVYRREQNLRQQISLLKGGFLLLLLGATWGLIPSLSRIIMLDGLHPLGVAFWTLSLSAALMIVTSLLTGRYPQASWPPIRHYLILGLIGGVLPQIFLFWAAESVPAMIIAIILAAESFIVFVLAASMGLEAPSLKRFIGLSLGLACVALIMVPGSEESGVAGWIWILVTLAVPLCYALEDIVIAALPDSEADSLGAATGITIAGALILAPATFATGAFISPAEAIAGFGWAFLLIAALSAFSTVLLIYTIRTTGAVFASQAGYSITAGGILWSVLLLNEQMTIWVWAALACLVSGLALVMPKQIDHEDDLDQRAAPAQIAGSTGGPGPTAP
ncbi:Response regulator PleD [Defluviimonas aquaemixtae]|uniref:Response regulator PleD n=1 Tax=Albidovulum aquaemixtae TaxID=1542388 RepID=A0A2R8B3D0_9RHOB|nr:response regulator [Defluviimonas aquaemixtae]SPH17105.1 Response regulator PleD [Defluviimonas aquaemixtae]